MPPEKTTVINIGGMQFSYILPGWLKERDVAEATPTDDDSAPGNTETSSHHVHTKVKTRQHAPVTTPTSPSAASTRTHKGGHRHGQHHRDGVHVR